MYNSCTKTKTFLNANKKDALCLATTELNLEIIRHTEVIIEC